MTSRLRVTDDRRTIDIEHAAGRAASSATPRKESAEIWMSAPPSASISPSMVMSSVISSSPLVRNSVSPLKPASNTMLSGDVPLLLASARASRNERPVPSGDPGVSVPANGSSSNVVTVYVAMTVLSCHSANIDCPARWRAWLRLTGFFGLAGTQSGSLNPLAAVFAADGCRPQSRRNARYDTKRLAMADPLSRIPAWHVPLGENSPADTTARIIEPFAAMRDQVGRVTLRYASARVGAACGFAPQVLERGTASARGCLARLRGCGKQAAEGELRTGSPEIALVRGCRRGRIDDALDLGNLIGREAAHVGVLLHEGFILGHVDAKYLVLGH